jgi:hypothetical protein
MAAKRYTLVSFDNLDTLWEIHKPGCENIKKAVAAGGTKALVKTDLEATDEEILDDVEAFMEMTMEDVYLCGCTGYVTGDPAPAEEPDEEDEEDADPLTAPPPSSAAARASQAAARAKLLRLVEETVDKLVAERGEDNIGDDDRWHEERLATCTDDFVYDLAVEVRKLRERGDSWWRVAYELHLPGSGASNKQGRKGSAFARRLWRAAWGKTYLGERGQRESKLTREARAMENLGRPYFSESEDAMVIIEKVRGKMLHWVTRLGDQHGGIVTSAQEAYVHDDPKFIRVKEGPKGPYLEFFEQIDPAMLLADPRQSIAKSGPLRAVYIDRITRVGV